MSIYKYKSLEQHIKRGTLIRTEDDEIYEVSSCGKILFECVPLTLQNPELVSARKFYYNIPMIVYQKDETNIPQRYDK